MKYMQSGMTAEVRDLLMELAARYESPAFLEGDPSWWMHQVTGDGNREAMAFVASGLSYGSRSQFMPKIGTLLDYADGDMKRWICDGGYERHFSEGDKACFYRLYNAGAMYGFFSAYRILIQKYGSLGEYIRAAGDGTGYGAVVAICQWFASQGASDVVPKDATSACKRICMFLRWMVRDDSPVDLGLWTDFIDKKTLLMPLDTHVVSEAMKLGLLQSRCASMGAARRLTDVMSEVFPDDPLKGDFALFGYGVKNV